MTLASSIKTRFKVWYICKLKEYEKTQRMACILKEYGYMNISVPSTNVLRLFADKTLLFYLRILSV